MMQGIAIQPGLPIAGAPAVRNASAAGGNRFSDALNGTPKDPDRAEDAASRTVKQQDGDEEKKVDRSARPRDERDDTEDEDTTKKDDRTGSALPPHMQAERTLAQQWPASARPAATDGSTPAGKPDGEAVSHVPTGRPATDMDGRTAVTNATAANAQASALRAVAALTETGTAGQVVGKHNVATAAGTTSDPTLKNALVAAVTTAEAGKATSSNPSVAFVAKVAALQHDADAVGSSPKADANSAASKGAGNAAANMDTGAVPKIDQALNGQESGNGGAGAGSNRRGEDGNGKPVRIDVQGVGLDGVSQSAGNKSSAPAAPLLSAQMLPASGSAPSFAGALAQGGALARYTSAAAAAIAAGAPPGSLPAQSLSIQLRPVELGAVTANLKYAGSGLTIDIQVETAEAHRRLSNDSSDIVKSLQSLGFQVDKVTVRQALAQPQSQGQPQGQTQGQAMGRDGSAAGFAGQGGAQSSMSGQSGAGGHRQDTENRHDQTADRVGMVQQTADRLPRRGVFI
jgi:chemotaxis protein MotD